MKSSKPPECKIMWGPIAALAMWGIALSATVGKAAQPPDPLPPGMRLGDEAAIDLVNTTGRSSPVCITPILGRIIDLATMTLYEWGGCNYPHTGAHYSRYEGARTAQHVCYYSEVSPGNGEHCNQHAKLGYYLK
jgi:hypothetical protein